jgi:hypothetical protein
VRSAFTACSDSPKKNRRQIQQVLERDAREPAIGSCGRNLPPGAAALWIMGPVGKKNADRHDRSFHGLTDRGRSREDTFARPRRADRNPRYPKESHNLGASPSATQSRIRHPPQPIGGHPTGAACTLRRNFSALAAFTLANWVPVAIDQLFGHITGGRELPGVGVPVSDAGNSARRQTPPGRVATPRPEPKYPMEIRGQRTERTAAGEVRRPYRTSAVRLLKMRN